jgi:hypothetical protein
MAIAARVGCKIPKNTNLTTSIKAEARLIKGPYSTASGNTTLYTCMVATVDSTGAAVEAASKAKPAGVVINDPDYAWNTTTPGNYVLLPSLIDIFLLCFGSCMVAMDVSEVTEASLPIGTPVWCATNGSGFVAPQGDTVTGTAGEFMLGTTLDENCGFTTLAAGADGDLVEVFVNLAQYMVSTA